MGNHSNMNQQQQQPGAGAPEDCKLFVYGVSIRTAKEELQAEVEKFGQVLDAYNSGKGYAFITFQAKDEADAAKEALNGQTICGQEIKVDVAKPRGSGRPRGPGRGVGERGRGSGDRGGYGGPRGGYDGGRGRGRGRGGPRGAPRGGGYGGGRGGGGERGRGGQNYGGHQQPAY